MADTGLSDNRIVRSSGWWFWIILAVGIGIILLIIWGGVRLFRNLTSGVEPEPDDQPPIVEESENPVRFVRTPTEIIIIDDPIIPEGEVAVEAIVEDTEEFLGENVVTRGDVENLETTSYFTIRQDEGVIGVIALPEVIEINELETAVAPQNQVVRITGTVKILTKEREKTEFGLDFRHIDEAFWQDQLVIEAVRIEVIDGTVT